MPQSADCFMLPDFSPLGLPQGPPSLMGNHNNSSRSEQVLVQGKEHSQERILHNMTPLKLNGMSTTTTIKVNHQKEKGKESGNQSQSQLVDLDIEMNDGSVVL